MIRPPPISPLFPTTPLSRSLTLELLQPRGTNEFRKMLYRRWTKKQNRVCLAVQNLLESLGLRGPPCAIGNHLDRKSTRLKLQSRLHLVCRLLLEKKTNKTTT